MHTPPILVLYGAGNNAISAVSAVETLGYIPVCFCDSDPNKEGTEIRKLPVLSWNSVNEKYDDFLIYVTPNSPIKHEIIHSLLAKGISKERIVNYEKSEYRFGCYSLENCLLVVTERFHYCCGLGILHNLSPMLPMPTDTDTAVEAFLNYREELVAAIQNPDNSTPCNGCPEIKKGYYTLERKVRRISFSPEYPCNLSCTYCVVHGIANRMTAKEREFLRTFDFAALIKRLEETGNIVENCPIEISAGEITINPRCDEILDAVKEYPVTLFSNCVIYSDKVQQIINKPDSFLLESLDAGTSETYAKIKGKDVFESVRENILRYANNGGNIELKYIVTEENCTDADFDGFIDVVRQVKPRMVRLSCNVHSDFINRPMSIINFTIRLGKTVIENGFEVLVSEHFGEVNDRYIKEQIFN